MGALTDVINSITPAEGPLMKLEVFTNGRGIVINALTNLEGITVYESSMQVMTQQGPAQINFRLEDAVSPLDALGKWHIWAKDALTKAAEQIKANESRIIRPTEAAMNGAPARAPFTMHKPT